MRRVTQPIKLRDDVIVYVENVPAVDGPEGFRNAHPGSHVLAAEVAHHVQVLAVREFIRRGLMSPTVMLFLRRRARLKREDFADLLGYPNRAVVAWEEGQVHPPRVVWALLAAHVLGVDPWEVLQACGAPTHDAEIIIPYGDPG